MSTVILLFESKNSFYVLCSIILDKMSATYDKNNIVLD